MLRLFCFKFIKKTVYDFTQCGICTIECSVKKRCLYTIISGPGKTDYWNICLYSGSSEFKPQSECHLSWQMFLVVYSEPSPRKIPGQCLKLRHVQFLQYPSSHSNHFIYSNKLTASLHEARINQ